MKMTSLLVAFLVVLPGLTSADPSSPPTAHAFDFVSIDGDPLPMAQFRGKAVLVVNTASRCGFTHQYSALQALWSAYRDQGLVVLGVPSNDFGSQERGSEAEIKHFCEVNFDVDFPMTSKVKVKGGDAHPFYRWAAQELGAKAQPRWNFHKYLIAPDGKLVGWFPSSTAPDSKRVVAKVEAHLPTQAGSGT